MFGSKLDTGEKIIVVVRKHWLIFAFQAFLIGIAALAPIIAGFLLPSGTPEALAHAGLSGEFLLFLYTLYILQLWTLLFIFWTTYFLDTWIVTNHRVINVDQQTLFYRNVTTLMIEKIQDVTVEVRGVFATLFGFGKLILRTAGDGDDISINFAAHPQYVKECILSVQQSVRDRGIRSYP